MRRKSRETRRLRQDCQGKRIHATYGQAQRTAARMRQQAPGRRQITVYRCVYCQGWHVGHASRRRSSRREAA